MFKRVVCFIMCVTLLVSSETAVLAVSNEQQYLTESVEMTEIPEEVYTEVLEPDMMVEEIVAGEKNTEELTEDTQMLAEDAPGSLGLGKVEASVAPESYNSLTLSWKSIEGVTGYQIYRATELEGTYEKVAVLNKSYISYTDTNLTPGTTYYYKIRAYSKVDGVNYFEEFSDVVEMKVLPAVPNLSEVGRGTSFVGLSWDAVELPDMGSGYNLYWLQDDEWVLLNSLSALDTEYTVTSLDASKVYQFRLTSFVENGDGSVAESEPSDTVTVLLQLTVPASVRVSYLSHNSAKVTWKAAGKVNGYEIYRRTAATGYVKVGAVAGNVTSFTNTGLKTGETYYYAVKSYVQTVGKTVYSDLSAEVSVMPKPLTTAKVSAKSAAYNKLTVSWSKVKGSESNGYVTGYLVYRSTKSDSGFKQVADITSGKTVKYTDKNVTCGTTYYYKIRPYCMVKGKRIYAAYSTVASAQPIPATPKKLAAEMVSDSEAKLTWKKVTGATGYKIYRSESEDGKYKLVTTVKKNATVTYTNKKLELGKTYFYKIKAYAKVGSKTVSGKLSSPVSVQIVTDAPENVKAVSVNPNKIKVTWDAIEGAESYNIYRSTSKNGKYKLVKTTKKATYTDSNTTNGKYYHYRVCGVVDGYEGLLSDKVSARAATLSFSESTINIFKGETVKIPYTATPAKKATFKSANTKIATVNKSGQVTGHKVGKTKIYVTVNGIQKYVTVKVQEKMNGIDVSKWQGNIDFKKVKAAGYDFVMMRAYSGYSKDPYFEVNYKNAKAAGLKVGVYSYSVATSVEEVNAEARAVLEILQGRDLDFPVALDLEDSLTLNATNNSQRTNMVHSFKKIVEDAGYQFILYANLDWLNNYLDNARLDGVDIWIARYCDPKLGHRYTGGGNVTMWQYTSTGSVDGISGNVDLDFCYKAY